MEMIEAQVLDAQHLKLFQRLDIPPGSKIFIIIAPSEAAIENEAWARLSAQGLAKAYGDDEPEYSRASIKEPNPEFQP